MAQTTNTRVQVTIELGHTACIRKKQTSEGFTHDWSVFVRGPDGSKIQHFIEKVVFNLHDTFSKPKRTVKEPPYQVSESGYASFLLPIDIYFRNKELPKKISFKYDLYLNAEGGPPINHTRCEKLTFQNPTEEFRQKLLKAGGQVHYGNGSQQSFDIFGTPITPDTGNKRPAGTSSSGKDKSSKGKSGSKPSTPQSHMSTTVSSSSSSSSGPATQPIASKEPKSSKSSSSSSSSTRETIGQKRPSVSSPEQTSGKKMKRSSSTSSNTESSSKHKSHKSSKKKSDSDKSEKRKSSSSKHHKEKSEHKEKKKKEKSESSHSKSSSSLSKSMPELKLKNELLSPLHDSPPRSLSPPHSKPDLLDSNSDSNSNSSHKRLGLSPKDSPISSLSAEDTDEMTRKILEGKGEDDLSSSSSKSDNGWNSVKPLSSSDSDLDEDIRSNHSESKSQRLSSMSPKVSKNSSVEHKSSPVKTDLKSSPLKPESKSSKSKHSSSKKSSSSKSESKSKDSKDKKDKSESSSSKHSRATKDKGSRERKEKENGQCENGIPEKAPNGENIKELLDLQVILCRMTDRRKLQNVVDIIGPTGLFKVSETSFSFDLCNIESDIVQTIKSIISESLS